MEVNASLMQIGKRCSYVTSFRDITESKQIEDEKNKLLHEHGERVKELNCLYGLSKLAEDPDSSLENILHGLVDLIPSSWQYPEDACAKIICEDYEFQSTHFKETGWKQEALILINGENKGVIQVFYLKEFPNAGEGPFQKEERKLINEIAIRLGNIIQQKKAGKDLLEAFELNDRIIKEFPVGLAIYEEKGQCIAANNSVGAIIGATLEEVLAQNYNEIESWEKSGLFEVAKKSIALQKNQRHEFYITTTFGKKAFFDCQFVPFIMAGKQRLMLMIDDITERKVAEASLQESQEKILLLLNSTGEGIYGLDMEGNCTFCNLASLSLLGYETESQLLGRNMHNLIHHTKPDGSHYPEDQCQIYQAFRRKKGTYVDNEVLWRADGTSFAAEYRSHPILRTGEIVGSVVSFTDISERREAEELLKKSLAEKETLLREIHHRVKNNMQIVASLMFLQAEKSENQEALEILLESQDRVKSMGLIHEQLYRSGNLAKVPFKEYVKTLVQSLRQSHGSIAAGVSFHVEAEGIELPVDSAIPCGLIVNELIINSLKHAFNGKQSGEVAIRFVKETETYTLSVSDNGIGLPDDYDWSSPKTLGLHLVRTLSGQLDAELEFHNDNGLVCRLSFRLPK